MGEELVTKTELLAFPHFLHVRVYSVFNPWLLLFLNLQYRLYREVESLWPEFQAPNRARAC